MSEELNDYYEEIESERMNVAHTLPPLPPTRQDRLNNPPTSLFHSSQSPYNLGLYKSKSK